MGIASPPSPRLPTRERASAGGPPGRARALPFLRGARPAVRRARIRGRGVRLLRQDRRGREAGRRLRVHAPRRADDAGRRAGGHRRLRRPPARRGLRVDLHRRLLLRWPQLVAGRGLRARSRGRGRLLRASRGGSSFGHARPTQRAADFTAPILALQGGDDPGIPVEDSKAFDDALAAAGVEHEVVIYAGAPHSFFDRKQEEFADASEDAWNRVLAFLGATPRLRRRRS